MIRTQAEFIRQKNPNELTQAGTVSANLNQPIEEKCKDSWFHLNESLHIQHIKLYSIYSISNSCQSPLKFGHSNKKGKNL